MNNGKVVLAVLASVAAGAALGVLFLPDKGSSMRKKISKKGEDLTNALGDKLHEKFDELLAVVPGKNKTTRQETSA
jgi:gas vesicle protein